jgi:hypothetical protein
MQGTCCLGACSSVWLLGVCYAASEDGRLQPEVSCQARGARRNVPATHMHDEAGGVHPCGSHVQVIERLRDDFRSHIWVSYRRGFTELGGFSTDVGWGCTLRTGQMLAVEALLRHQLGRAWRHREGSPPPRALLRVLSLISESQAEQAALSIHSICSRGKLYG